MATLTTQAINRAGITPTYVAPAAGGDACECGDNIYLDMQNTSATSVTVTLAIPASASTYANVAYTNTTVVVPITTGNKLVGPISSLYKDPVTGLCTITTSAQPAGFTYGCFKLQVQ